MKDFVLAVVNSAISVNGEQLNFEFENPLSENVKRVDWYMRGGSSYETADGVTHDLPFDKYTDWVQPFVELHNAEKQRIQEEKAAEEAEYKRFPNAKARKREELNAAFETAAQTAHCQSSLGFEIDADETANRNIEGLTLVLQPGESTLFRAYDNTFHEVTREELETMRREIVKNSQWLYQAKWTLETQIRTAETVEALEAITVSPQALAELAGVLRETTAGEENGQTE